MFKKLLLLVMFSSVSLYAAPMTTQSQGLSFAKAQSLNQLHPLLITAKKQKQFVLIDFNTQNCPDCAKLEKYTFSDAKVQAALQPYQLIATEITANNQASFKKRFNVQKTPALVFLDNGGQALPEFTTTGFVSPSQLLSILARVSKGNEN